MISAGRTVKQVAMAYCGEEARCRWPMHRSQDSLPFLSHRIIHGMRSDVGLGTFQ